MTTTFVSTSIPYVNAAPHIGFALELVLADVIARWHRLQGEDVFFLTGTDENALTNVQAAEGQGITPRELCDRHAPLFEQLVAALGISTDGFIRTSEVRHHRAVQQLWRSLRTQDLSRRHYRGVYCVRCERFYEAEELRDGVCPTHGVPPEVIEEENHFFALSRYQQQLASCLADSSLEVLPDARRKEALAFVEQGLLDSSVSRSQARSRGWGVAVPTDGSQTVYVWLDALTNYLSGLGFAADGKAFERYWLRSAHRIHVIGKDILRFHAVLWPAVLASAGLPLPTAILAHGFLTVDGEKISKSSTNAVSPLPLIDRYGSEALRYYLLRATALGADGDFSESRFAQTYQSDLVNGLGNLVRRLETLCARSHFCAASAAQPELSDAVRQATAGREFREALRLIWDQISILNQEIERARPWEALKEGRNRELHGELSGWVTDIRQIGQGLQPFLPNTATQIEQRFSCGIIEVGEILFPRLT